MDNILVRAAGGGQGTRDAFIPDIQIVAGIADNDLLTGCAAGGVQTDDVL